MESDIPCFLLRKVCLTLPALGSLLTTCPILSFVSEMEELLVDEEFFRILSGCGEKGEVLRSRVW